ncbi:hypothetical protein NMG60_11006401 [Bertholletia excelsa]
MSDGGDFPAALPHVALFPSAGMGHLTPFLRLAATLASRNCTVTLITTKPTVSAAESTHTSRFFTTHPHIRRLELEILPYTSTNSTTDDPFFIQFDAVNHSVHLLHPLLSSCSPPVSAIFSDIAVAESISPVASRLFLPNYIVFTSSARFLSLFACLPQFISETSSKFNELHDTVEIPGLCPLPISSIPPPFFNPNHLFTKLLTSNAQFIHKAKALVLNTFDRFESESISVLNSGKFLSDLPPIVPLGPLDPWKLEDRHRHYFPWLDEQRSGSVVYVGFGSRTTVSSDQIREMGSGLERSGRRFIWALKASKVDKEDNEEIRAMVGDSFLERTKNRGIIAKNWVNQEEILSHPAVGGFVSHCGWNSVMEAARHGVPVLAWPQHGDQKVNAEVVEKAGLGVWVREWGWGGEKLVKGEEIAEKISEMMGNEKLKNAARRIGEEARNAWESGGSSETGLMGVLDALKLADRT